MESFNPFSLSGKTLLVTGGSSGIGRGISVICSKMGANVIVIGRDEVRLGETITMLEKGDHQKVRCDLTVPEQVKAMVESLPPLDGVVHCAGIGQRILCKNITRGDINKLMNINFEAPILLQKELISYKKCSKGGSIIFITSIASTTPSIGNAIYSASKGALISYAKCLSLELAPRKIRVNCISPGMVWTDLILRDGLDEEQLKEDESKYPLKRYGTPEDIANLVVYMLSDASTWMTGSNVVISGGII